MSVQKQAKINSLLQNWPQGTIATASWLVKQGISRQLQRRYKISGWIEKIGRSIYKRTGNDVDWQGWLYAMQEQDGLSIHAGGLTAIELQGSAHYVRFKERMQIFNDGKMLPPNWLERFQLKKHVELYQTSFLPPSLGLTQHEHKSFNITISSLERAILECLYFAPEHIDLVECYHIMESLAGLRPDILRQLLESCSSIKVKRLFLCLAEKTSHDWLQFIHTNNINLGTGKRSIVDDGYYDAKYQITLPKELGNI